MPRPTEPPPKGDVKYMPQDAVEQFKASVSLFTVIIYMIVLVNLISGAIAFLVTLVMGFRSASVIEILLFITGFILCLTMTIFVWRWSAKERCKYLEARRKVKEANNLTGRESRGFWHKYGDYVLAVVFAVLIPVVMILTIQLKLEDILALSIVLAYILMFILSLVWFYCRYKPVRPTKVIKAIAIFIVVAFFFIGATPSSWVESKTDPDNAKISACKDNLRTIDSGIFLYEEDLGEGVYPTTIEELVPTYISVVPEEPFGGYYYIDTTTTPPRAACSEGHTY